MFFTTALIVGLHLRVWEFDYQMIDSTCGLNIHWNNVEKQTSVINCRQIFSQLISVHASLRIQPISCPIVFSSHGRTMQRTISNGEPRKLDQYHAVCMRRLVCSRCHTSGQSCRPAEMAISLRDCVLWRQRHQDLLLNAPQAPHVQVAQSPAVERIHNPQMPP